MCLDWDTCYCELGELVEGFGIRQCVEVLNWQIVKDVLDRQLHYLSALGSRNIVYLLNQFRDVVPRGRRSNGLANSRSVLVR